MKKTRFFAVLAAFTVLTGMTVPASAVSWKDLKNMAKDDFEKKKNKASGKEEAPAPAESTPASDSTSGGKDSSKSSDGTKSSGSVVAKKAAASTEPNSEEDFDWSVNDELTEITITKYKGTREDVVIPATIQDVPVVAIGGRAFNCNSNITSIIIPEGVKRIEGGAFSSCYYLSSFSLPKGIVIGGGAFHGCDFSSIVIPEGATLGAGAYDGCRKLTSVTLPEGLKAIPAECFQECDSLTKINFPSTLKYIGDRAFGEGRYRDSWPGCPLSEVNLPEGLEYLGRYAFDSKAITSVSLPKSLKWVDVHYDYSSGISGCIFGDNIENITIAEGCAPKYYDRENYEDRGYSTNETDGRSVIKGSKIEKSIKLQKQLKDLKVGGFNANTDSRELKADLKRYGVK